MKKQHEVGFYTRNIVRHGRDLGMFTLGTGLLLCLLFVLGYSYFVTIFMSNDLILAIAKGGSEKRLLIAACVLSVPAGGLYWLWRRGQPFSLVPFMVFYLLFSACVCGAYAWSVDPAYVSDFGRMWQAASRMAETDPLPVKGIIGQRALFVAYPVVEVFGASAAAMEFANSTIFMVIGLVGYMAMRTSRSHLPAQAFALSWLCCFEPVMAIGIPTHDLWGLLFISLGLWVAAELYGAVGDATTRPWLLALAAPLGALLALAQLQREVGVIFLLATAITLLWVGLHRERKMVSALTLVILFVFYGISMGLLGVAGAKSPPGQQSKMNVARLVGFSGSFSTGRFDFGLAMRETFIDPESVDNTDAALLARSVFLTDSAEHPARRVSNVVSRLAALSRPGSQQYFYISEVPPSRGQVIAVLILLSSLLVFGLGACSGTYLLSRAKQTIFPVTATMVFFSGGMLIVFCTLSELQPRYAFFMWMTASMLVANGLFEQGRRTGTAS